jgi:hypothetical protein
LSYEQVPDGINFTESLDSGDRLRLVFREIRRERTGVHAFLAVMLGDFPLGHDTFNLGRQEDRIRLSRAAHKMMSGMQQEACSEPHLRNLLDITCLAIPRMWEEERLTIEPFDHSGPPPQIQFALRPYVIEGAGTIYFAPPGSGKSYLLQLQAISLSLGLESLWPCAPWPILYVNLERSAISLHTRERALLSALGRNPPVSHVEYLHARGAGLAAISRRCRRFVAENPGAIGMLDSISRTSVGGLNDDTTANSVIDVLNATFSTWVALGHTSKANPDALFGSQHWTAGADVVVQLSSQTTVDGIGLRLQIQKANDIGKHPPEYLRLGFEAPDQPVSWIRKASAKELPELVEEPKEDTAADVIEGQLAHIGSGSATDLAKELGIARQTISSILFNDERFRFLRKDGQKAIYGLASPSSVM